MLSYLAPSSAGQHMFEEDFLGQRARSFPGLGAHGLMSAAPQAFPFAGFPVHPAHDPMGFAGRKLYPFFTKRYFNDINLVV